MKRIAASLIAICLGLLPGAALAQLVPPAPGVELPQAYFDRIAEDKTAFQFQKAWIGKAKRAKKARKAFFETQRNGMPGPEPMSMASLPDATRQRVMVAGTVRVPVVVISYSNKAAPFSTTQIDQQLFTGPTTSAGTLTDLYDEMSYGNLNLTGDVYGVITTSQSEAQVEGGCNGLCPGVAKTGRMMLDALNGIDAAVDFGQYDNDGPDGVPNSGDDDGFVDFIAFVQPESGGECGGSNLWSHRWVLAGWPEFGGNGWASNDAANGGGNIRVYDYTIQPSRGSVTGCGNGIIGDRRLRSRVRTCVWVAGLV